MSKFQLYEFVTLGQRLTAKQMAELRTVSTRAEITPTSFRNEYHYGDFRGTAKLMARYFDAHRYFAAWGTPRLMLRPPKTAVDLVALKPYFASRSKPCLTTTAEHVVLDFHTDGDEREFACDEDVSLTLVCAPSPSRTTCAVRAEAQSRRRDALDAVRARASELESQLVEYASLSRDALATAELLRGGGGTQPVNWP